MHFSWIGHYEHLAAISQTEVRHFNLLQYTAQLYLLLAPVKLAGVTWLK